MTYSEDVFSTFDSSIPLGDNDKDSAILCDVAVDKPSGCDFPTIKLAFRRDYTFENRQYSKKNYGEWKATIEAAERALATGGKIGGIGCAIGIQNFLKCGSELLAGIRWKAEKGAELHGNAHINIGQGRYNTGYLLMRGKDKLSDALSGKLDDLFVESADCRGKKIFSTPELFADQSGLPIFKIAIGKEIKHCLVFINESPYFPRLEIGVCKHIELMSCEKSNDNHPMLGWDEYSRNEYYNHWLWVKGKRIRYWSFRKPSDITGENINTTYTEISLEGEMLPSTDHRLKVKPKFFNLDGMEIPDEMSPKVDCKFPSDIAKGYNCCCLASPALSIIRCFEK